MRFRLVFLAAPLLALVGCASTLDAASTAQNAKNVREIAAENTTLSANLDAETKNASRIRNEAAVRLAEAMAVAK